MIDPTLQTARPDGRPATVLLVEDDPNDAFLVTRAFKKAGLAHTVVHLKDGQEAVEHLSSLSAVPGRTTSSLPELMLLDLKMPRLNGFEVLQWLRVRPEFKKLPVIVLSSSDHERDKAEARSLGATDYFRKPSDPADLLGLVRLWDTRWLTPTTAMAA